MKSTTELVRERLASSAGAIDLGDRDPYPPATLEQVRSAEDELGFVLPEILVELYVEVANGGFGPGCGLAGILGAGTDEGQNDLIALWQGQRSEYWLSEFPAWPPSVVRLAYFGCAMYAAVDLEAEHPVFLFEPNSGPEELGYPNCLIPYDMPLERWLRLWAMGEDVQSPPGLE